LELALGVSPPLGVGHVAGSGGVVPPQPVLGYDVEHDGKDEQRDDEVEAHRDTEHGARGVRQRQTDALQKPEVVKRDFRFDTSVGATRRHQTYRKHIQTGSDVW